MEGNEQLAVIIPMLKEVAEGIGDDQLGDDTPCSAFDVAGVLDHMTGLATAYSPAFRGEVPDENDSEQVASDDDVDRFQQAMDALLDAVQSPGASERTIQTPGGPMPGATFSRLVAFDGLIHGWDLASSTGQQWQPPEDLVTEVDIFAREALTPDVREGGAFAPEQQPSDDAGVLLRLVAFSGRSISR